MNAPRSDAAGTWHSVQLLTRAVAVLDALASRTGGWTLDALAAELDLNKASLLRILRTFEDERLVRREADHYELGPRILDFSHGYLRNLELGDAARASLAALALETGQTVSLALLDGLEVVYVAIERAQQEIGIQGEVGARHPANATALGKVLLAGLDPVDLAARLQGHELVRLTHRTIVDPEALLRHLDVVRDRGYAIDDEERGIGIRCVGAPVRRADGGVIAAVSVAGPIFHMTEEVLPEVRDALLAAVANVSERFGYHVPAAATTTG